MELHYGTAPAGWVRVTRGVQRTGDPEVLRETLLAWQAVLPDDAVFTGPTSALVRGWWTPPLPEGLPVFVSSDDSDLRIRRPGLVVARHQRPLGSEVWDSLRLASPAETLVACARRHRLLDTVVYVDAAASLGDVTLEEVRLASGARRRGAPRLRAALPLVDGRSESIYEVLLKALHRICGIRVEGQHEVYDEGGEFLARGDLWITGTKVLHEFDGAHHLDRAQQRKDLRRARRLAGSDWVRRGYTAEDVLHQGIVILRDADRAVGRPHSPRRIRAWNAMLRDSLFTPSGTAAFLERLGPRHSSRETGHLLDSPGPSDPRK